MKKWNEHSFQNMWIRFLVQIVWNRMIEGMKILDIFSNHLKHIVQISFHSPSILFHPSELNLNVLEFGCVVMFFLKF